MEVIEVHIIGGPKDGEVYAMFKGSRVVRFAEPPTMEAVKTATYGHLPPHTELIVPIRYENGRYRAFWYEAERVQRT